MAFHWEKRKTKVPFFRVFVNSVPSGLAERPQFSILSPRNLVRIDNETGELSLLHRLDDKRLARELEVEIEASHPDLGLARTVIVFQLTSSTSCNISRSMCFTSEDDAITIDAEAAPGTPVEYVPPPMQRFCNRSASYTLQPVDMLSLDDDTRTLKTIRAIPPGIHNTSVFCKIDGNPSLAFNKTVILRAARLYRTSLRGVNLSCDFTTARMLQKDRKILCDLEAVNVDKDALYRVFRVGDERNLFRVKHDLMFPDSEHRRVIISVTAIPGATFYPDTTYSFDVVLEEGSRKHVSYQNVTYKVTVTNDTLIDHPLRLDVSRANLSSGLTARFTRVIPALSVVQRRARYRFSIADDQWHDAFAITRNEGIVYVKDTKALLDIAGRDVKLRVIITDLKSHNETYHDIHVSVEDSNSIICGDPSELLSCASAKYHNQCEEMCGDGARFGHCSWHRAEKSFYESCTPDPLHCPDQQCDELERENDSLCPQDCAPHVTGVAVKSDHAASGIPPEAGDFCFCLVPSQCTCELSKSHERVERSRNNLSEKESHHAKDDERPRGLCGRRSCINVIKVVGLGGMLIAVSIAAIILLLKSVPFPKPKKPGSEKRDTNQDISPDPDSTLTMEGPDVKLLPMNQVDVRWEVRRDNLLFENVLGEGEFGKVMRAQAWSIAGRDGYTTVAVKMLKDDACRQDQQDLLQELQMLKEVDHVNVIRLLGACTSREGPLYVIVEYCEYGSLRSYLRRCRNISSTEDLRAVQNPTYLGEDQRVQLPSARQLTSFMWQIARGMSYLSDMKVIHRDLAARNILVATDFVVKISDFGLSRDVYEGDTYLKRSRQRVPVKWMAIESLEDQIYTTRSDVWSFGVVLWEIVSLGATPYPGLSGERLCHLLKQGYRMYQPDNCSDQLYAVMRDCWRPDPNERPSFRLLAQKFDRLLQDTTIYLDVEDGVATCSTYYNDDSVTSEETIVCGDRPSRVEAQLEGGVVKSHLLKQDRTPSSEYLNDDERNRLLHYAKMDFARSSSDASSDQEHTSSV
ncbi:proto-oncogene tyrosine-protein kinase receptor Ret [Galendromus occidentalis]|uniref:Proto-oncogene tyrosine-protein kinase receptor Ret n=1 Tax=Galendromus occidentalis TaxID=34638 RepID=A0AAJ7SF55_9ACAR|nr:proto-oncogene tyrosine-protein kinase receptor Ret [Galendromus occidentalis]